MSKFKYYIVDTINEDVKGTDNKELAMDLSDVEGLFIVGPETGEVFYAAEAFDISEWTGAEEPEEPDESNETT